ALAAAQQAQATAAAVAAAANAAAAGASLDPNATASRTAALAAAAAAQAALNAANASLAQPVTRLTKARDGLPGWRAAGNLVRDRQAVTALNQAQAALTALQAAGNLIQARPAVLQLTAAANDVLAAVQFVQAQSAIVQARAVDVTTLVSASFDAARLVPARGFGLAGVASSGSGVPFLTDTLVSETNSLNATVTPLLSYRALGTVSADGFIVTPGITRTLQIGFSLTGAGATQSSTVLVATGSFLPAQAGTGNDLEFVGGFFASGRASAVDGPSFATGSLAGADASVIADADGLPVAATFDSSGSAGGLASPAPATQFGYIADNPTPNYAVSQTTGPATAPAGLGGDRTALTLRGYVAGSLTSTQLGATPDANGLLPLLAATRQDFQFAGLTGTPDDLVLVTDPNRRRPAPRCRFAASIRPQGWRAPSTGSDRTPARPATSDRPSSTTRPSRCAAPAASAPR
uniref:hypothetical protein n=1 Tax=uncultured Alsobacter sp. TaxID=1748258 RepID=UPI0025F5543A